MNYLVVHWGVLVAQSEGDQVVVLQNRKTSEHFDAQKADTTHRWCDLSQRTRETQYFMSAVLGSSLLNGDV